MTRQKRNKDRRRRARRGSRSTTTYKGGSAETPSPAKVLTSAATAATKDSMTSTERFEISCTVSKVHGDLGLVFGWAMICKDESGVYIDLQDDHIPEASMLKAVTKFAKGARMAKEMHVGGGRGTVLFLLPLTAEIAKSLDIECPRTGLIIGMAPDGDMLEKFRSGELQGFSIGGRRIKDVPQEIEV